MGERVTPEELEQFYRDVDALCAEIFDASGNEFLSEDAQEPESSEA